MNNSINKRSFYGLLEEVLNKNYDDDYKFVLLKRDLSDYGTDILGTRYIYFIEDGSKRRFYESYAETVKKRKVNGSYMNVSSSHGKYLTKENIEKLLSPHVMEFPVTMIIPEIIENVMEDLKKEERHSLNENDKSAIVDATALYHAELSNIKSKVGKRVKKNG